MPPHPAIAAQYLQDRLGWDERGEPRWYHWTEARVIAAIKRWTRAHGRPPDAQDWAGNGAGLGARLSNNPPPPPKWPTKTLVQSMFGSWNAGIRAAGFEPRPVGMPKRPARCRNGHKRTEANTFITGIKRRHVRCRDCIRRKRADQGRARPT